MSSYDFQLIYDSFFGGLAIANNLLSTGILVLTLVARGFIFNKANEPAWATVVPFYNLYVMYKISGKKKLFAAYLTCYIVTIIFSVILVVSIITAVIATLGALGDSYSGQVMGGSLAGFIASVIITAGTSIAMLVMNIFMSIGLAKSFGKGGGFACGLIFLPVIFYCIIAFSKNIVYRGPGGGQIPPQGMNNFGGPVPPQGMNNFGGPVPPQGMNNFGGPVPPQGMNNYGGPQTPPPPYMGQSNNNQVNHFMSTSSGSSTLTIRYR